MMKKKTLWLILAVFSAFGAIVGPFASIGGDMGVGEVVQGTIGCAALAVVFYILWKKADPAARFQRRKKNVLPSAYVSIDIETTGLSPQRDNIIELGAVKIVNGKPREQFSQLIYPGMPIPALITQLTGITDADLQGQPDLRAVLPAFAAFIGKNPIIGHNLGFDIGFINAVLAAAGTKPLGNPTVDTLPLARQAYPSLPNHKLETIIQALGIADKEAHRATDDALRTAQVYETIRKGTVSRSV